MNTDKSEALKSARLYVIVGSALCRGAVEDAVLAALRGGADVIQLREKGVYEADYVTLARRVKKIVADAGKTFIVNDNPSVALSSGADGVHVGADDVPLLECRLLLGPDAIVGVSTHSVEDVVAASEGGADYVGFGPVFETETKAQARPALGLEPLRAAAAAAAAAAAKVPLFAIGGMTVERVAGVLATGAHGIAVASAIASAEDVESAARRFREQL